MKVKVLKFKNGNIDIVDDIVLIPADIKEKTINTIVNQVIEEYKKYDSSICDILASIAVNNLSIEDVVTVYSKVYSIIEGDKVIRNYFEGGHIDLATGSYEQ